MYIRPIYEELKNRMLEVRDKIQAIVGARQVGKSTMVKYVLDQIDIPNTFVTADNIDPTDTKWIDEIWESARAIMRLNKNTEYILAIDEIHKINNWSEAVKRNWDSDTMSNTNIKLILLGSSRMLIKDGLTESLLGRYELLRMTHWSYKEMHEAFGWDVNQYIYFGGYPGTAKMIKNESRWKKHVRDAIIEPIIRYDILMTKFLYKPELMRQLIELGCAYSGQELSLTKMVAQLQDVGNVGTVANYLNTLNEAQVICGMQKYANDTARKYNSVPKLFVYNTALMSTLKNTTFEKAYTNPHEWGHWVESTIAAHLLNQAEDLYSKIYYWRERNKEVDFIVEYNGEYIAIEVKSSVRSTSEGLTNFKERFNPKYTYIVGTDGIPIEKFLQLTIEQLFE